MRALLRFVVPTSSSQLTLPPAIFAPSAATTVSDVPVDDYSMWLIIGVVYLASVAIFMAVFALITIYHRHRRNSSDNQPAPLLPRVYFMEVELIPLMPHKQGLKKSALKALPKTRYEKAADVENQAECAICLTEFEEGEQIRKLPQCRHEFHIRCIDRWLRAQPSCPSCRTEVIVDSRPKRRDQKDASRNN
jgi:Ring finger domain